MRSLAALLMFGLAPLTGEAQDTPPRCASPEHRQFDFWVGRWTVTDSSGRTLGTSEVTRIAGGCGLHEHWRGAGGGEGMSLNVWEPTLRRWRQFWVGAGAMLELTGGLDPDGRMVLEGERRTSEGVLRDRITWTPLASGVVLQQWDISRDGGRTWRRSFEGYYRPDRNFPPG